MEALWFFNMVSSLLSLIGFRDLCLKLVLELPGILGKLLKILLCLYLIFLILRIIVVLEVCTLRPQERSRMINQTYPTEMKSD